MNLSTNNLESLCYKDLQKIAKQYGIPANLKKDVLLIKIQAEIKNVEVVSPVPTTSKELELPVEVTVAVSAPSSSPSPSPLPSPSPVPTRDSETIKCENEVQQSIQVVEESSESSEYEPCSLPTPEKAELSSACYFEGEEGEENETEELNDENDPENRLGGKLLGIATPVGQKKLFNSPAPTPSYNVHWTYEAYESDPLTLITPLKQNSYSEADIDAASQSSQDQSPDYYASEEASDYLSPEHRLGSNKLQGIPTPNGKSIFFLTPTDKKAYEEYNVHWRYEDYENEVDNLPPFNNQQNSIKTATTPRSAGRFKYVHAHP